MKILRLIAIAVLAFAALVLVGPALPGGAIAPRFVQIYETTDSHHFVSVAPLSVAGGGKTIYLDDRRRFQRFKGVGAAMTWSSAYNVARLPAALSRRIIYDMYGPNGARSDVVRVPEGASDRLSFPVSASATGDVIFPTQAK